MAAMRSGPTSIRSKARYRTPGCCAAISAGSRRSVLPISTKWPGSPSKRNEASTNSPASEFSTTSNPRPRVVDKNFSSKAVVRESAMWSSSNPNARNVSHLPWLAVAKTSAPQCRASCTAAIPTPPVAACTKTRCPARTSAKTDKPYNAVKNTTGTPAASSDDHPVGTAVTNRASTTASEPTIPNKPITGSPTANPHTPGPTSTTTPAPSAPNSPPPGYIPNATNTSRKFTPTAATATRTWPAASSTRGLGPTTKSSSVPPPPVANRQPAAGSPNAESDGIGASRAAYATPARITNCGSPQPITALASSDPSESTNTTRSGCSAWADRTNPHTAAPAKSVTSSPATATAPRVSTTSTPRPSPANQDCNTPNTSWAASYTARTPPDATPARGSHITMPSPIPCSLSDIGDQATSSSPPSAGVAAADNWAAGTGRMSSFCTDNSGSPVG